MQIHGLGHAPLAKPSPTELLGETVRELGSWREDQGRVVVRWRILHPSRFIVSYRGRVVFHIQSLVARANERNRVLTISRAAITDVQMCDRQIRNHRRSEYPTMELSDVICI
jgi:hypothetical protein